MRLSRHGREFSRRKSITIIVAAAVFGIAMPIGAGATLIGSNIFIADPTSNNRAKVDAGGALKVGDGAGPLTVDGSLAVNGNVGVSGLVNTQSAPAQPYSNGCVSIYSSADTAFVSCSFQVPVGKHFKVDTLTVSAALPKDQSPVKAYVWITTGGTAQPYYIPLTPTGTSDNGLSYFAAAPNISIVADPGSTVELQIEKSTGIGGGGASLSTAGHLY